jgi:hypothetical protein
MIKLDSRVNYNSSTYKVVGVHIETDKVTRLMIVVDGKIKIIPVQDIQELS